MSIESTRPFLRDLAERRTRVDRFLVAAHALRGMPVDDRIELIEDVVAFLADTLIPHADAAESLLYPEAQRILEHAPDASSVAIDRNAIRGRIRELVDTDPRQTGRLQELLYALQFVCAHHVQKEEDLYLRLLGEQPEAMARVMDDMADYEYGRTSAGALDHV